MKFAWRLAWTTAVLAFTAHAQPAAELRAEYEGAKSAIEAEIQPKLDSALSAYADGIASLQQKKMIAKKVEEALQLKKEAERLTQGKPPGDLPSSAPMDWRTLRSNYEKQVLAARQPMAFKVRAARALYSQKLDAAERRLATQPGSPDLEAVRLHKMCFVIETQMEERGTVSSAGEGYKIEVPPEGALLLGFNAGEGGFFGHTIIKSLQPVFLTAGGENPGKVYGDGSRNKKLIAPPGYAVGAMLVKSGQRLDGFSITFMKIIPGKLALDPKDTKQTDWIGGGGGGGARQIGGNGKPVVGVAVKSGSDVDGLGIVQLR